MRFNKDEIGIVKDEGLILVHEPDCSIILENEKANIDVVIEDLMQSFITNNLITNKLKNLSEEDKKKLSIVGLFNSLASLNFYNIDELDFIKSDLLLNENEIYQKIIDQIISSIEEYDLYSRKQEYYVYSEKENYKKKIKNSKEFIKSEKNLATLDKEIKRLEKLINETLEKSDELENDIDEYSNSEHLKKDKAKLEKASKKYDIESDEYKQYKDSLKALKKYINMQDELVKVNLTFEEYCDRKDDLIGWKYNESRLLSDYLNYGEDLYDLYFRNRIINESKNCLAKEVVKQANSIFKTPITEISIIPILTSNNWKKASPAFQDEFKELVSNKIIENNSQPESTFEVVKKLDK